MVVATIQELKWYVLYVKPNHEMKVEKHINNWSDEGLAAFCPARTEIREWSDRKKKLRVPLLKRIVFVRAKEVDRAKVFHIPGTVSYLYDQGAPGIVQDAEIEHLKQISENPNVISHEVDAFTPGNQIALDRFGFENEAGVIQKTTKNNIWVVLKSLGYVVKLQVNQE